MILYIKTNKIDILIRALPTTLISFASAGHLGLIGSNVPVAPPFNNNYHYSFYVHTFDFKLRQYSPSEYWDVFFFSCDCGEFFLITLAYWKWNHIAAANKSLSWRGKLSWHVSGALSALCFSVLQQLVGRIHYNSSLRAQDVQSGNRRTESVLLFR